MHSRLFSSITLGRASQVKNRVALAPLTNRQSHADGTLSDAEHDFLALRAAGDFGLVSTCAAYVHPHGKGWAGELGIDRDELLPGLQRLAGTLSARGALGVVQLFHGGARAPSAVTGLVPLSASEGRDPEPTRAASADELAEVETAFVEAAVRAERAGFGGVELHGAHGYLFGQFLSTTGNRRDDAWGGSLEHRARLLLDTTRAVRRATGPGFVVGVRLSLEDYGNARGLDLDESLDVARALADAGIDFLHASLWDVTRNTIKRPGEHALGLLRAALPSDVRLIAAGKVWTREDAEEVLDRGADLVALGRAGIVNPDWPRRCADPTYVARRPPLSAAELAARAVSPVFADYLRGFKGFVTDDTPA